MPRRRSPDECVDRSSAAGRGGDDPDRGAFGAAVFALFQAVVVIAPVAWRDRAGGGSAVRAAAGDPAGARRSGGFVPPAAAGDRSDDCSGAVARAAGDGEWDGEDL